MKTIPIPPLSELEHIATSNEAIIYKWNEFAIKIFHIVYGQVFNNKMFVLSSLYNYSDLIDIPALILPKALASRKDKVQGYLADFVEGSTLEEVLKDPTIDIATKTEYLKQIGMILQLMHERRKRKELKDFYISDLHGGNLIIEKRTGNVRVGDMDSAHICGNRHGTCKYLVYNTSLQEFTEKYRFKKENSHDRDFIINENTEYYCYAIILLNALTLGDKAYMWSMQTFYNFLEHMAGLGASKELLDILAKIYTKEDNEDFTPLLDETPEIYARLRAKPFYK